MSKVKWQKIAARRASVQKTAQFAAGAFEMGRYFGLPGINNQAWLYDGRTTYVYFGQKDTNKYLLSLKRKVSQLKFVKEFEKRHKLICKKYLKQTEEAVDRLEEKSLRELFVLHQEFEGMWTDFYSYAWMLVFLAPLEEVVTTYVTKKTGSQERAQNIMAILAQPDQMTPIIEAERAMFELVSMMQAGEMVNEKVEEMVDKFGWMSVYDFDDKPRSGSYYITEAKKIMKTGIDADAKLVEFDDSRAENERKYMKFLSVVDDELVREQIKLLHASGYVRDLREEVRDRLTVMVSRVYVAMAELLGYTLEEVIQLTTAEIEEVINNREKRPELRDRACVRQKDFVLMQESEAWQVLDEDDAEKMRASIMSSQMYQEELSGQVAYVGQSPVRGTVKVILSGREVDKIKEGDVLVASMTKPDYVSAMKKAVAFVTDEGGLLSHAAIVAREMKKTCVLGTKVATQILKDGDMVEVDADKGIVKKL